MINHAFLPMFFFNPFNLKVTRVTIIAPDTNMCSPLVAVNTLLVLRINTIGGNILVHDLTWHDSYNKPGVSLGEGGGAQSSCSSSSGSVSGEIVSPPGPTVTSTSNSQLGHCP